jgi:hypothetical protein
MDVIETLQEYFFKKNVKVDVKNVDVDVREYNAELSYACGCGSAAGKRDCGTSSHDLSTYVWCTDGDGIGISTNIRTDEDDCSNCRRSRATRKQGSVLSQSKDAKAEPRGRMCDASTSTFDLSTYVWSTEGDLFRKELNYDEGMDDQAFGFAPFVLLIGFNWRVNELAGSSSSLLFIHIVGYVIYLRNCS